jgi:protocatechuate 3,4-dioxygenase beta subunit
VTSPGEFELRDSSSTTEDPGSLPALETADGEREAVEEEGALGHTALEALRIAKGEVAVPPACTAERGLVVYAWSQEITHEFVQSFEATEVGDSLSDGATLLGSASVKENGSFRIELMTALEEVHLFALGQFTYSEHSTSARLSDRESETLLTTLCGGRVQGEISGIEGEDPTLISALLTTSVETVNNVRAESGSLAREVELSPEGNFDFIAVPTGHTYEIRVQPELMAPALLEVSALAEGEERLLKHTLEAGGELRGRVLDPSGNPVPGAKVKTIGGRAAIAFMGWATRETETDKRGEFILSGLPHGRVMIAAGKEGYLNSGLEALELGVGEKREGIELLLSDGNSLTGSVRWPDGQPASGALVKVSFHRAALLGMDSINAVRGSKGSATTDEEGAFRVSALGNGPFTIKASRAPEGARLEAWLAEEAELSSLEEDATFESDQAYAWTDSIAGVRPDESALELNLKAPEVIAGRATDDRGEPLTEYQLVLVRLEESALGSLGVEKRERSIKDPEGRFIYPGVSAGSWHVYAIKEGFARPEPAVVDSPRPANAEPLLFILSPASSVSGVVSTPNGAPAHGALVRVQTALSPMISGVSMDLDEPITTSGSAGEFKLEGLRSGEIELVASAEGFAASAPLHLTLMPGEELKSLRIELRLGGSITGVLYDEDGTFASGATVQVIRPTDYSTQLTSTDGNGFFSVEHLEPGSWQVVGLPNLLGAVSGGEESQNSRAEMMKGLQIAFVELADGAQEHVILGEPPADPVLISGTVTHHDTPLEGVMVVMIAEGKGGFPKIVSTDSQGRYELKLNEPGHYMLAIQRSSDGSYIEQEQSNFRVEVPSVHEYRYDVALPSAKISGRVTLESGEAAANAPVSLTPDNGAGFSPFSEQSSTIISCSEDGTFSIEAVMPGNYRLRAGGVGYIQRMLSNEQGIADPHGQSVMSITIKEDQLIDNISLVLPLAASIKVKVLDSTGAPMEGATVFVRHEDGTPAEDFAGATTDSQGLHTYRGLSSGSYQVSARTSGRASTEGTRVQISAGETRDVELQLEAGTLLRVSTVDGDGQPVASSLRVIDSEGRDHASYFSIQALQLRMATEGLSRSRQTIGPLPPGRYRVYASDSEGKEEDKPVNLRGQAERAIKIRFR